MFFIAIVIVPSNGTMLKNCLRAGIPQFKIECVSHSRNAQLKHHICKDEGRGRGRKKISILQRDTRAKLHWRETEKFRAPRNDRCPSFDHLVLFLRNRRFNRSLKQFVKRLNVHATFNHARTRRRGEDERLRVDRSSFFLFYFRCSRFFFFFFLSYRHLFVRRF